MKHTLDNPEIREPLIYVDPARPDYVIPFNVLAIEGEHPCEIAATVQEGFRRTWPECLREAPHFSNIVTAALIALIQNGLTLMYMPRLLTDDNVIEFHHDRHDREGREALVLRESTLNKIDVFSLNPRLKLMLGHTTNHLVWPQFLTW